MGAPVVRNVLSDAEVKFGDPKCCIPYSKIRNISPSGVSRLMLSFAGELENGVVVGGPIHCHLEVSAAKVKADAFCSYDLAQVVPKTSLPADAELILDDTVRYIP